MFVGVVDIENIDARGEVLQYGMQNEAPPQYTEVAQIMNTYQVHDVINPYGILGQKPSLGDNHFALVG